MNCCTEEFVNNTCATLFRALYLKPFTVVGVLNCSLYVFFVCSVKKEHPNTGTDSQYLCL